MAATGFTPLSLYYSVTTTNAPTSGNLVNGELAINITDGKLFYKDNSGVVQIVATKNVAAGIFIGTGAVTLPAGTTAQQPTGVQGMLRFNTTTTQFEGYNGTAWASVGGAAISNDTATATAVYPLFANATSGTALTVYTSNAKYLYTPSTGLLAAPIIQASNGLILNSKTIGTSYTIPTADNAMSVGPITISSGVTITVPSGSRWLVL
jgi:hypothetical protein